jgi:hypothetical protein
MHREIWCSRASRVRDVCDVVNNTGIGFGLLFPYSTHVDRLVEGMVPDSDSYGFHVWQHDSDLTSQCFDVVICWLTQSDP